ncbi:hypothetical protein COT78_01665 [Candidatus Berkelbacteria bacterium CG10_big_fil_rev_8_21_14_0_10_43_13]|uniref:Uncharacterized protein n=1 Tax=Candidatus Berkelbacteria bacterium CG10_big_fil_rev_8_21_14_0_10_43_13 TaxID=1974514 RepID=A0A2H0W6U1_9BACT|nr:MAG: hypothetical protein COT78_01665 [Candidatus Berkelbacteria bacterium CG10_big_fil_rev_8_21_14_0_10_43_13]
MNKIFYLESDEEITKVINRIRQSEEDGAVLVIPRNSTLTQSVINLKLLKRGAEEHKKMIGLVTTDRVTKNLADQLGVKVFSKVSEAEKAMLIVEAVKIPAKLADDADLRVNTYKKYDLSGLNKDEPLTESDDDIKLSKKSLEDVAEPEISSVEHQEENIDEVEEQGPDQKESDDKAADESKNEDDDMKLRSEKGRLFGNNHSKHIKTGGSRKPLAILAAVTIIVLLVVVCLFLPSAKASLVLKTADLDKTASINVDKSQKTFDLTSGTMPGTVVKLEKSISKSFASTGQKDAGTKATGTVTISNGVSSGAIPLSAGTKVTSADGAVFTIDTGVMIPGMTNVQISGGKVTSYDAGTADVAVTASANGDGYNLPINTKFTVSSSAGVLTAANKAAFAGGVTKNITFVSQEDLDNVGQAISDQALADNKAELLGNAEKASVVIDEKNITINVISTTTDKNVNDEAESFAVTAAIKLSAFGFSEKDLRAAMEKIVEKDLKSGEMLVNPEGSDLTYKTTAYNSDAGTMKLDVNFKAKTGTKISADTLIKGMVGKSATSAQNYLESQNGVASVSIGFIPKFWRVMPFMSNRIDVKFDYQK